MSEPWGPHSDVSVLPNPLPIRYPGGTAGALIALVLRDGHIFGLVIGEEGQFYCDDIATLRVVPRPGDDLRMAVGWAVETPSWTALAADRRR